MAGSQPHRAKGQRGLLYLLTAGSDPKSIVASSPGGDVTASLPKWVADWMPGSPLPEIASTLPALATTR